MPLFFILKMANIYIKRLTVGAQQTTNINKLIKENNMGLAEKRIVKMLEEEVLPEFKTRLNAATGKDIEVAINWDSFTTQEQLREVQHQCLGRIADGIERLASDDMAKEAIADAMNQLTINNIDDAGDKSIQLADGVLTVNGKWEDFGSGIFTDGDYANKIEEQL